MRCPVCKNETHTNDKECTVCGFTELSVEFLNVEEAENWHRMVVMPARALWNAAQRMQEKALEEYRKLEKKTATLKKKYDSLSADYESLRRDFDTLAPLSPKVAPSTTNPKPGWNTSGPVAHPNFFEAKKSSGWCEISNISCRKSGNNVTFDFLVKKTYDRAGQNGTSYIGFIYKVKDPTGIVIGNAKWLKDGLCVGDVVKGSFSISGITASGYSVEFFDDN